MKPHNRLIVSVLSLGIGCGLSPVFAQPQLAIRMEGGLPVLSLEGPAGTICQVQWSDQASMPSRWFHLSHVVFAGSPLELIHLDSGTNSLRFFRAVTVPSTNMVLIPSGWFQMGDAFAEGNTNELPVHTVYVDAFYLEKYEVSRSLWEETHQWALTNGFDFTHAGSGRGADYPVESIDWEDAVKWCNARSQKEGLTPVYYTQASLAPVSLYRTGPARLPGPYVDWGGQAATVCRQRPSGRKHHVVAQTPAAFHGLIGS